MTHRMAARAGGTTTEEQLAITWHSAALLLGAPCEALLGQLEAMHRASHRLSDALGGPLRSTIVHLERASLAQLEQEYLAAFGRGDRLEVGPAQRLALVLEQAASVDAEIGLSLLAGEQPVLERLQAALFVAESGWLGAVSAVTATLSSGASNVAGAGHLGRTTP